MFIFYLLKHEWSWWLAIGIALGNFVSAGLKTNQKEIKRNRR
jgi:hypothetical protein